MLKLKSYNFTLDLDQKVEIDVVAEHGGKAHFVQVTNFDKRGSIKAQFDGDGIITVPAQSTQCINGNDGFKFSTISVETECPGAHIEVVLGVQKVIVMGTDGVLEDIHGNPIVNSAGEPYDPPIEEGK